MSTDRLPVSRGCTPAGGHEADKGFGAVFRYSGPMSLVHHHEEDLPHSQALEQAAACVHFPHCMARRYLLSTGRLVPLHNADGSLNMSQVWRCLTSIDLGV